MSYRYPPTKATGGTTNASALTSGTVPPARAGTGTPAAGKYVDGATGAWTPLPVTSAVDNGDGTVTLTIG